MTKICHLGVQNCVTGSCHLVQSRPGKQGCHAGAWAQCHDVSEKRYPKPKSH